MNFTFNSSWVNTESNYNGEKFLHKLHLSFRNWLVCLKMTIT